MDAHRSTLGEIVRRTWRNDRSGCFSMVRWVDVFFFVAVEYRKYAKTTNAARNQNENTNSFMCENFPPGILWKLNNWNEFIGISRLNVSVFATLEKILEREVEDTHCWVRFTCLIGFNRPARIHECIWLNLNIPLCLLSTNIWIKIVRP